MDQSEIELAEKLYDKCENKKLTKLLQPFIKLKDPFALNLISSFSQPGESASDFDKRYIRQKIEASELGSADASCRMGVNHLYGDNVERDHVKASKYFERAIQQGHSHTKFIYGFSLYYGTDGNMKDANRGLKLIREAANEGVELAVKELNLIADKST